MAEYCKDTELYIGLTGAALTFAKTMIVKLRKQCFGKIPSSLLVSLISIQETLDGIFEDSLTTPVKQRENTNIPTPDDDDLLSLSVKKFPGDTPSNMVSQNVSADINTPVANRVQRRENTFMHSNFDEDSEMVPHFVDMKQQNFPQIFSPYVRTDSKITVATPANQRRKTFKHTTDDDDSEDEYGQPFILQNYRQRILFDTKTSEASGPLEESSFFSMYGDSLNESSFIPVIESTAINNQTGGALRTSFKPAAVSTPKFLVKKKSNNTYSVQRVRRDLKARTFNVAASEQVNSSTKAEYLFGTKKHLNKSLPIGYRGTIDFTNVSLRRATNETLPFAENLTAIDPRRASRGMSLMYQLPVGTFVEESQGWLQN